MNEETSPERQGPNLEERLVGYLDGELDAAEATRIEQALAADPRVRRELWQLERSWELLDELPRTEVDDSFTRSTVEMIAVRAEADLAAAQAQLPKRQRRARWLAIGVLLGAAAAGFLAMAAVSHRANQRLLEDLPIVEKLDQYRDAEDIEFLRLLKAQGFLQQERRNGR
jgi:anti-sigma factor RsiW